MSAPENPPAFPCLDNNGDGLSMRYFGMTLRDHFAGQALTGFVTLAHPDGEPIMGAADTAKACYNYADAMLAERAKGGAA